MDDHRTILEAAADGELPKEINDRTEISVASVRELIEAGYLEAIDASSMDGPAYLDPRITYQGRLHLKELEKSEPSAKRELLINLGRLRDMMIAVSTGGPRIDDVNAEYRKLYAETDYQLSEIGIENENPFPDLWDWYGHWGSGDLPSYRSRRDYLSALFKPMLQKVRAAARGLPINETKPTGWAKVDRTIGEARRQLAKAQTEEQFQIVGLLCREAMISLAQAVYDPVRHPPVDDVASSDTDAKRMFDSFFTAELDGSTNEALRRHARASFQLAVALQHKRTAGFRDAALCVEATSSVVNVIAIVSGKRDPSGR